MKNFRLILLTLLGVIIVSIFMFLQSNSKMGINEVVPESVGDYLKQHDQIYADFYDTFLESAYGASLDSTEAIDLESLDSESLSQIYQFFQTDKIANNIIKMEGIIEREILLQEKFSDLKAAKSWELTFEKALENIKGLQAYSNKHGHHNESEQIRVVRIFLNEEKSIIGMNCGETLEMIHDMLENQDYNEFNDPNLVIV